MIEEGGVAVSLYEVEARRIIKIIRKDKSLPEQNSISGSENIARKGTPQCLRLSAVFTLEAAVVMPVLACFFVSVLFFFRIMQIQLEVQRALDDTGRKLAVCAATVSSDGAALPGMAEALLLRDGGPHGRRNLHHRWKVWNQPDWIRFLRGGDHTAGGVSYPAAHPDLLVVGFCDGTAGRLQEMDRMECCRGK